MWITKTNSGTIIFNSGVRLGEWAFSSDSILESSSLLSLGWANQLIYIYIHLNIYFKKNNILTSKHQQVAAKSPDLTTSWEWTKMAAATKAHPWGCRTGEADAHLLPPRCWSTVNLIDLLTVPHSNYIPVNLPILYINLYIIYIP